MSTSMAPRPAAGPRRGKVPKASDLLAERLRARILGRGMQPGDHLPSEAELIAAEGYSRGTVREALRLLESDGLIEIRRGPQGGIRVARPDPSQVSRSLALLLTLDETTVRSFSEFRQLIEPAAAAAAARTATTEQREWLSQLANGDVMHSDSWEPSVEFHEAVGECSNNALFRLIIAALGQDLTWQVPGDRLGRDHMAETNRAHRAIARAVVAGDSDRASSAMLKHLKQYERVLARTGRLDEPLMPRERWLSS